MGGWVVGNQDKKLGRKCVSQEKAGRLARVKVQQDASSLPSLPVDFLSFSDRRSTL